MIETKEKELEFLMEILMKNSHTRCTLRIDRGDIFERIENNSLIAYCTVMFKENEEEMRREQELIDRYVRNGKLIF